MSYRVLEIAIVTGSVNTRAITIRDITLYCSPAPEVTIVPAIPEVTIWGRTHGQTRKADVADQRSRYNFGRRTLGWCQMEAAQPLTEADTDAAVLVTENVMMDIKIGHRSWIEEAWNVSVD